MSRWYILDDNGEPVEADVLVAGRWMEDNHNNSKRVVAFTEVEKDVSLSTIFLGLNHSWTPGKVLLYESLWFGGPLDGDQRRYATRAEAEAGHKEMLEEYGNKEMHEAFIQVAKDIVERNL